MYQAPTQPPLIPLRLTTSEQWVLHHVLSSRLEGARRRPGTAPPPLELARALEKLESGSLRFTVAEIRRARAALTTHVRSGSVTPVERREVGHLVDRIDSALARRSPRPR